MLVPIDKETSKKKTKLTAAEKKEFDNAQKRATGKRAKRVVINKHPGLRSPKPVKKAETKKARK